MPDADPSTKRLALLIDADNVGPALLPVIIREASALGTIIVRRVYGHFASPAMSSWQEVLHAHALTPIHVPPASKGKNATDMKLAIEAMDLLHQKHLDGICIASSDSDFTALASRLREDGLAVYGFGEKRRTTPPYVAACDRFFYCDLLLDHEKQNAAEPPKRKVQVPKDSILSAVDAASGDDGTAHLGLVGNMLLKRAPDFDHRLYGYKKLSDLVSDMPELELVRVGGDNGTAVLFVRRSGSAPRQQKT